MDALCAGSQSERERKRFGQILSKLEGTRGSPRALLWTSDKVIRAATLTAAELLGRADRCGSLDKGHVADIIAVAGDPLADIGELERVRFVMKGVVVSSSSTWPCRRSTGSRCYAFLRSNPNTREVPVIILSASVGEEVRVRALEAGADRFLGKPCSPDELENAVRGLLAARHPRPPEPT